MVHADGDLDKPVAIIQANLNQLAKLADEQGIVKAVLDDLNRIGKKGKLGRNELLGAIALVSGTGPSGFPGEVNSPWTAENGFLTASNKIDRNAIKNGKTREINGEEITGSSLDSILQPLRSR